MARIIVGFLFFTLLLVVSCSKDRDSGPVLSAEAQRKIDSLEAYNDSIAKDKKLHYQFTGTHTHLNTSGKLSEHAHQDLPRKRRIAKLTRKTLPARKEAYRKSQERQQKRMEAHMKKTGKSLDTSVTLADSVVE